MTRRLVYRWFCKYCNYNTEFALSGQWPKVFLISQHVNKWMRSFWLIWLCHFDTRAVFGIQKEMMYYFFKTSSVSFWTGPADFDLALENTSRTHWHLNIIYTDLQFNVMTPATGKETCHFMEVRPIASKIKTLGLYIILVFHVKLVEYRTPKLNPSLFGGITLADLCKFPKVSYQCLSWSGDILVIYSRSSIDLWSVWFGTCCISLI